MNKVQSTRVTYSFRLIKLAVRFKNTLQEYCEIPVYVYKIKLNWEDSTNNCDGMPILSTTVQVCCTYN